jgi:1-phosphofructokinase
MVTITLNPAIDHAVTVPNFRVNAVNRATDEVRTAGGKGLNVASFLADFGVPTLATGFLGRANAKLFEIHLAAKQIEDRFVRVEGESRVNLKILNPAENEVTDVNFPGLAPTADDLVRLEAVVDLLAANHQWFVLSGSLPPGLHSATYRSIVTRLRTRGRKVLLDTSGETLRDALLAGPTVIKPNARELEEALGREFRTETELLEEARRLVKGGIQCVIVSRGADGALFVESGSAFSARHPGPEIIRTTVGAGDALVAGYLAAQIGRLSMELSARLAIAFSIAALQRVGAARLPARPKLAELAEAVQIRKLD